MIKLLRRGLDAYEGRTQRRDDQFSEITSRHIESMDDRSSLSRYVCILSLIDLFYFVCILLFPFEVYEGFQKVSEINERIAFTIFAIIFGTGLWLTYAVARLKFPDLEKAQIDMGVMTSYASQENGYRRFRVWVVSVLGGILNLLGLLLVELILVGN